MRAEIINVGTELLIGSTLNTHQQYLAQELGKLGVDLYTAVTLGDNPQRLGSALTTALLRSELVLVTGGLGPTDDDITVKATARALGLDLVLDPAVRDAIGARLKPFGRKMDAFQLRQAYVPRGASIFSNPNGTAPGIFLTQKRFDKTCHVALLPGPPRELCPMVQNHLIPRIKKILGPRRSALVVKRLFFPGAVESQIAPAVNDWLNAPPPVTVGIYARAGEVELAVMAKDPDAKKAERLARDAERRIAGRFPGRLILRHPETLLSRIVHQLSRNGLTLAVAESCTGGLLAGRLTEMAGASDFFSGGVTAYDNRIKTAILGVEETLLKAHGAVSPEVAAAMAERAAKLFDSDFALSVTGIAGPSGGSRTKPVGLVYIGLTGPDHSSMGHSRSDRSSGRSSDRPSARSAGRPQAPVRTQVFRHVFLGNRSDVRAKSVQAALIHLVEQFKQT